MFAETIPIDRSGRITLPKQALDALGISTKDEVILELTDAGIILKPKHALTITEQIAAMNLPVSDWEQMENEIEQGRMK